METIWEAFVITIWHANFKRKYWIQIITELDYAIPMETYICMKVVNYIKFCVQQHKIYYEYLDMVFYLKNMELKVNEMKNNKSICMCVAFHLFTSHVVAVLNK